MLRFRSSETTLTPGQIKQVNKITNLGLSDIQNRAAAGQPLLEIEPFMNDWQEKRPLLDKLAKKISAGSLPLHAFEVFEDGDEEGPLTSEELFGMLQAFRDIEKDTDMNIAREMGDIDGLDDYLPGDDDDWML